MTDCAYEQFECEGRQHCVLQLELFGRDARPSIAAGLYKRSPEQQAGRKFPATAVALRGSLEAP